MKEDLKPDQVEISEETLKKWQSIVDTMADRTDTPSALIMRLGKSEIEVFTSSRSDGSRPESKEPRLFFCLPHGFYDLGDGVRSFRGAASMAVKRSRMRRKASTTSGSN